jgi:hypothetical protein
MFSKLQMCRRFQIGEIPSSSPNYITVLWIDWYAKQVPVLPQSTGFFRSDPLYTSFTYHFSVTTTIILSINNFVLYIIHTLKSVNLNIPILVLYFVIINNLRSRKRYKITKSSNGFNALSYLKRHMHKHVKAMVYFVTSISKLWLYNKYSVF